jgi:hypothetical protein
VQGLHVDHRFRLRLQALAEYPGRALEQLIAPLPDLVRVDVEILRRLDQGLLAAREWARTNGASLARRCHRHFRLECRAVVPARSSCHGRLLARSIMLPWPGKSTHPGCSDFWNHIYPRRRHPKPGYLSPMAFEAEAMQTQPGVHETGSRPA